MKFKLLDNDKKEINNEIKENYNKMNKINDENKMEDIKEEKIINKTTILVGGDSKYKFKIYKLTPVKI